MGIVNPLHLLFVAVIALVVLGPKRLPELARSLGHGMREFRDSIAEASGGEEHVTASLVPEEAQLVVSSESPLQPAGSSTPIVDPDAPARSVGTPVSETSVSEQAPPAAAGLAASLPVDPPAAAVGLAASPPADPPPPAEAAGLAVSPHVDPPPAASPQPPASPAS